MNSDDQHWLDSITLYVQRNPQIAPYAANAALTRRKRLAVGDLFDSEIMERE
jgi:hypothetical protein